MNVPFCNPFLRSSFYFLPNLVNYNISKTSEHLQNYARVTLRGQKDFSFVLFSNNSKDFERKALIVPKNHVFIDIKFISWL